MVDSESASSRDSLPRVWIFQPAVKHYRLPVWDRLARQSEGRYRLAVFGPLEIDRAEIDVRPYLHPIPLTRQSLLGRELHRWPGAARLIRRERPEVVLLTATVSILDSWLLPRVARRAGGAVIGWSKVNSRSGHNPWARRQLKRRLYRRFDQMLCYGESSRDELIGLGYPSDRIRVAQNTIDTERIFERRDAIVARGQELRRQLAVENRKVLLCIGRMVARKRHADLISAWPDLRQRDSALVLVFVGGGELYDGLREAAEEIDSERILFTGAVGQGDDYAWLATADIVAIPGAVGLALNQAMAFGKPIVIADEPGADGELLRDGETGWRYPRGDIAALAETITQILRDPGRAEAIGQAAEQTIRTKATIGQMVETIDRAVMDAIELSQTRRLTSSRG